MESRRQVENARAKLKGADAIIAMPYDGTKFAQGVTEVLASSQRSSFVGSEILSSEWWIGEQQSHITSFTAHQ
jgi:hypothetical protein